MREKYISISFNLLLKSWASVLVIKVGICNYKGKPALFCFPQLCFCWLFFNSLVERFLLFLAALIVCGFYPTCCPMVGTCHYKLRPILIMTDSQIASWPGNYLCTRFIKHTGLIVPWVKDRCLVYFLSILASCSEPGTLQMCNEFTVRKRWCL